MPKFFKKSMCWKIFENQYREAVLNKDTEKFQADMQEILRFTARRNANEYEKVF